MNLLNNMIDSIGFMDVVGFMNFVGLTPFIGFIWHTASEEAKFSGSAGWWSDCRGVNIKAH